MKTLKLQTKKIASAACPSCMRLIREGETELKSAEMIATALNGYPPNRQGITNIMKAIRLTEKVEKASNEKAEVIDLEDAEADLVYNSVNGVEWVGLTLRFPEFFEEVSRLR